MTSKNTEISLVKNWSFYGSMITIIGVIVLFFFSIHLLGMGFDHLGGEMARAITMATSNPFIGLFIGILITAIFQSSSTITSMAVAAVAAGSITLENAVPIVMGANIGTTLTSTIVSMSYVNKAKEFRRAIAAGVSHDIFNILMVFLLFPLEYHYGFLSKISLEISHLIKVDGDSMITIKSLMDWSVLESVDAFLIRYLGAIFTLVLALAMLFGAIKIASNLLYREIIGPAQDKVRRFFSNTGRSFGAGLLLTSVIQSSSLTTSLIVPMVATGKVDLKRAFQFILGANLGTTITALLAAMLKSEYAVSLAIAHFMFNLIGVLIFLFIPYVSSLPTYLADKLGQITMKYRIVGFAYIIVIFFLLPATLIYVTKDSNFVSQQKKEFPVSLKDPLP